MNCMDYYYCNCILIIKSMHNALRFIIDAQEIIIFGIDVYNGKEFV